MLDNLSQRLSKIVKTMRGQARLTEANTKEMLREVRLALLEADVALPVVKEVLSRIKEKAMGEEVVGNLNPGQALVGVVQRELTAIIGGTSQETVSTFFFSSWTSQRASLPAVVVLPAPCRPAIITMVGGFGDMVKRVVWPPKSETSSSFTILMTCWAGVRLPQAACTSTKR